MKSITLIGMPGAGKSTIGRKFAKKIGFKFIDLDVFIKEKEGKSHTTVLDSKGSEALCALENKYAMQLPLKDTVFSPGGSIVYSSDAMKRLRNETIVINLELPLATIKGRLSFNMEGRGIVGLKEKGIAGLFKERIPLYRKFAHYTIKCEGLNENAIINEILQYQS